MYFSIWHRARTTGAWVIVALRGSKPEADREYDSLLGSYRSGLLRMVDPAGLVLRRDGCRRERVSA